MRFLPLLALVSCATASQVSPHPESQADTAPASAPARTWRQPKAVVIRHATVMPATGPAIADGAVSFADGKLVAVGRNADVPTPPGAEELDGHGLYVTPGIIDAHSHLGVYASPQSFSNDDGNETSAPVTAEISAEHSFWPQDPGLRRAAAGGVTSLLVLPGSANLIGGRGFPAKLHFGRSAAEVRFPGAKDSLKMACGENPRRVYGEGKGTAPTTRMANVAGYRTAFIQARDYLAKLEDYEKKRAKKGGKEAKDDSELGPPPLRDLKLETLGEVLKGNILVQNHCYRADEMEVMLRVADEFGFSVRAFHHALEAYKLRERIAQKGTAVATWSDWWGFKLEAWDGIPENAGLLSQAGVRTVIHSDSPLGIQRLNQEAAKAMWRARESGIPVSEEEALRWVTLNPAWVMGVDAQTGSLTPGKMADVVLWDGHPLSVYARASRVWVDGVVTYDARTGPAEPSDFEVDGREAAQLVAKPAPRPEGLPAACDAAKEPACSAPLPVSRDACVVLRDVTLLEAGRLTAHQQVRVQDGKVAEVGALAAAPAGCRTVEGQGRLLSAGFVDPLTGLGLADVLSEEASNDLSPRGDAAKQPVHAALRAVDSFNPASATLEVARLGGVTAAGAAPQGGLVPGQSTFVALDGRVRRDALAMHVVLGNGGRSALSSTRSATLERLRELLTDAREYGRRRAEFERNQMRDVAASRLDLEALQPVLAGTLPVVVTADRATDLRAALALAREFRLRLVVAGAGEGWMVADELAAAHVPVILQPTQNLPATFDSLNSRLDNAALLAKAGVRVMISTLGEPHQVRTLAQEAGNAVAWGLPWDEALRALTVNVAETFGLPGGHVAAGSPADLVLWSGDPLEASSRPVGMWIAGAQVPLRSRQAALFEKYRAGVQP
ncbi:amidohydrolase family protein [Aggregicoccus sp. 17bor-14]|uniref:amidohydrolase family protein n=1 Tax=Myxococcaceae TaxID=31 RepID=UPI00129C2804|nr:MULTISPECIES: amidohydrolase family protein [Myxococcaceae]MBF5043606.1 amidohydrolase family protein [Simulacricoccus sp. 17bor-14]MRI89365.1 amidohydrolase family protein [Aggregicoccus sp. 17bor-14]